MSTRTPSPSPPELSFSTVDLAVTSLLRWLSANRRYSDHDHLIHLVLSFPSTHSLPSKRRRLLPLPHPLHFLSPSTTTCLVVDDRPGSPTTPSSAAAKLSSDSIPVSTVLGLTSLKNDHKSFEDRKKLCKTYDVFFVDSRVAAVLPRVIGKQLWGKGMRILVVDLGNRRWGEQMRKACESACLRIGTGTGYTVSVGRASMGREKVVENVVAVARQVTKVWGDVRGMYVKSDESVALPIYCRDSDDRGGDKLGRGVEGQRKRGGPKGRTGEKEVEEKSNKKRRIRGM